MHENRPASGAKPKVKFQNRPRHSSSERYNQHQQPKPKPKAITAGSARGEGLNEEERQRNPRSEEESRATTPPAPGCAGAQVGWAALRCCGEIGRWPAGWRRCSASEGRGRRLLSRTRCASSSADRLFRVDLHRLTDRCGVIQTVGQRRVFAAMHASNAPCEDVGVVSAIEAASFGTGCLLMVLDGHGGNSCSVFMGTELPKQFQRHYTPRAESPLDALRSKFFSATPSSGGPETVTAASALSDAFAAADNVWLSQRATQCDHDARAGACALACYCEGSRMVFANAGDCRAVLGRHRPSRGSHSLPQGSSQNSQSSARSREPPDGDYITLAVTCDHTAKNASEQAEVRRRTSDPTPFRDKMNSAKQGSGSRKCKSSSNTASTWSLEPCY